FPGSLGYPRFVRKPQVRIENETEQRPAPGAVTAIGEQRVVGNNGAYSHQNGIALVPELMHVPPGFFTSDPAAACATGAQGCGRISFAGWGRDFAVQRHGRLHGDQRDLAANVAGKSLIQPSRLFMTQADANL